MSISKWQALFVGFAISCGGGEASQPAAPSELTLAVLMGPAVHIIWKDNSADEESFVLERKAAGGSFEVISRPPFDASQYHDAKVMAKTSYTYRVAAVSGAGRSSYAEATISTP